jgi:chorismate synthase
MLASRKFVYNFVRTYRYCDAHGVASVVRRIVPPDAPPMTSDSLTAFTLRHFESLADYDACVALQDDIWGHGFAERVPGAILRVSQKLGGVAAGAFDPAGRLLGFVFGMTGVRNGTLVHWSDMLAVRPEARGARLGEALKLFQRDAVTPLGVTTMLWTADPLVARNAHFNMHHLGARPVEYVENMYGANTGSVLHGAMPTDRFVYEWSLLDAPSHAEPAAAPAAQDAELPWAIVEDRDGVPRGVSTPHHDAVRIPVPDDLTAVQAASPARALAWRLAVRNAFGERLARGDRVSRFVRAHAGALPYYVVSS